MSGSLRGDLDETVTRPSALCGYLWKMKRSHQKRMLVPQWNKRWFSIEGRLLRWYTVASSEESSGMVDLRFITNVSAFEASGVFSFILSYPDRNLLLRASNLSDMNKWIRALQFQADIVRGGCGMTIVTDSNTSGSSPQGKGRAVKEKYRPPTLEANLEAAMVRLQILENRVLKQSYDTARAQPERSSKKVPQESRDRERDSETDKGNDDLSVHLRPEDVSLVDSTRDRDRNGVDAHSYGMNAGGHRSSHDPSRSSSNNDRRDYKCNNGYDSDEGNESSLRETKQSQLSRGNSRNRDVDSVDSHQFEKLKKSVKLNAEAKRTISPLRNSNSTHRLSINDNDDCIEEIDPEVRNSARIRSQICRHQREEREKEKEKEREKERGGAYSNNTNGSGSQNSRERESSNNNRRGLNGDWGYEGEMYNNCSEETFEGAVSRRQFIALNAAARTSSAGSHRSENTGSSRKTHIMTDDTGSGRRAHVTEDDVPFDVDDLPEVDLTVLKPTLSQRNRDRQLQRGNSSRSNEVRLSPLKSGGSNSGGWV